MVKPAVEVIRIWKVVIPLIDTDRYVQYTGASSKVIVGGEDDCGGRCSIVLEGHTQSACRHSLDTIKGRYIKVCDSLIRRGSTHRIKVAYICHTLVICFIGNNLCSCGSTLWKVRSIEGRIRLGQHAVEIGKSAVFRGPGVSYGCGGVISCIGGGHDTLGHIAL